MENLEGIMRCWEKSRIFFTAIELSLFDYLGDFRTSYELSKILKVSHRHLDRLMNALVTMGLLLKKEDKFKNSEIYEKYFNGIGKNYNLGRNGVWHHTIHDEDKVPDTMQTLCFYLRLEGRKKIKITKQNLN